MRLFDAIHGATARPAGRARSRRCLQVDPLEVRQLPASLIMGGIVPGSIDRAAEVDLWTFSGSNGSRLEVMNTSTPTQSGFAAYTEVFAPSGTRVAGFWAGGD